LYDDFTHKQGKIQPRIFLGFLQPVISTDLSGFYSPC
jgi:hypothetical protein